MERWTRLVLRFRWLVVAGWVVVFLASLYVMPKLGDRLTNRFTLPGTDTHRVDDILEQHFGQKSTGSFILAFQTAPGQAAAVLPAARKASERAAAALPTSRLVSVAPIAPGLVSGLIVSQLEPADAKGYTDDVREAVGEVPGATTFVTGQAAIENDLEPVQNHDLKVGELYIAIPIALLIMIFVFGTLGFLIPFVFAAAAIPATLGVVYLFSNVMELSTYVQNMVMLIGLGVTIDYSLLIVYRYREERRAGGSKEDAILRTMATAGRAVVFSGTAVAIGLALLLAMPVPFIRGFGVAGLAIPIVSVICALTLLPVLLRFVADALDRVRLIPKRIVERRQDEETNFWARFARTIMRRPKLFASTSVALLLALAIPVFWLSLGPGSNKGIPQDLEATRGLNIIAEAAGEGAVSTTDIAIDTGAPGGAARADVRDAVGRLIAGLEADPEVASVDFRGQGQQYVDQTGRYLHLQVTGVSEYGSPAAQDYTHRLREEIIPAAGFPNDVDALAGGGPPSGVDFLDLTYGTFPWLVLGVLALTYFLLLRAFRSIILPLKAIVLNLLSICAAYGLLVIVFKWGGGSALGLISFDQIEGWIPVFLFAMLFGLSMDYEVFLVSRMREEWDATHDNEHAVATGLAKTGRIVTAAGLVMFAAFMGFVAGSVLGLQQFGFGLAAAILIDITLVRALLLPSAMQLFGRWNWWLPDNVARVFRVKPSPLAGRRAPAASPSRAR
jgi:putative drug exporter of the RND superfamily